MRFMSLCLNIIKCLFIIPLTQGYQLNKHVHQAYSSSYHRIPRLYQSHRTSGGNDISDAPFIPNHKSKLDIPTKQVSNELNEKNSEAFEPFEYFPAVNYFAIFSVILVTYSIFFAFNENADAVDGVIDMFDPAKFQPVCPGSDTVYQLLKLGANSLVGPDNVVEYGPLIASVLLRVRLELCVLESFVYEAVVPFVKLKGLSWVLPIHETIETFLAGTIFALASNFILLGSTKIISVLFIYFDALTGFPARLLGGAFKKMSKEGSLTQSIASAVKLYGDILGGTRQFSESADTFVGRYLVILTTLYIAFKFLHFKVFNDLSFLPL